jgi:Ni,Fe-hydrogenase maturation factor
VFRQHQCLVRVRSRTVKNRRQESEDDVVLFAIEVTETGYGVGLSPVVQAAVPNVVGAVIAEISRRPFG